MTTLIAIYKAVAAAFTLAPWLRTVVFVLIAASFGFVNGCRMGRSWAKAPEPVKVEKTDNHPLRPWKDSSETPKLPAKIEAATVPKVEKPAQVPKQSQLPARSCRIGIFGRVICR